MEICRFPDAKPGRDLPQPSTEQSTEVFEVRGIVIPRDDIVI
jgi:hypothetical protein